MSEKPKALITGSDGFIGRPLSRSLEQRNYIVTGFDTALHAAHDVLDAPLVSQYVNGNDVVFHLAGLLGTEQNDDGRRYAAVNVLGSVNVLEAARQARARVVLASKINPWANMYSASKMATEAFARTYGELHNVDIRVAQMLNLYGPNQKVGDGHPIKAVPTFIMSALQNRPLEVFGSGEQTVDLMHVDDAVEALVLMGELQGINGEAIQLGTGKAVTVNFLAETIVALTDSSSPVVHIPMRSGEPDTASRIVADTLNMSNLLHFNPSTTLDDGLRDTIDWYRNRYLGSTVHYSVPAQVSI